LLETFVILPLLQGKVNNGNAARETVPGGVWLSKKGKVQETQFPAGCGQRPQTLRRSAFL